MPHLARVEQAAWSEVAHATGAAFGGTTLVRGPGARQVGEALLALGSSTVIAEEMAIDPEHVEPPEDAVDTVVLLHAWERLDEVDEAARQATGWLRRGGWLVLADLDVDRLIGARPEQYPSAMAYQMFPRLARYLEARSANAVGLVKAAIRAGLESKSSTWIERPLGSYASPSELHAAVEFGVWRGLDQLDTDEYAGLVAAVGDIAIYDWPLVEVEPWMVVAGAARV